MSKLIYLVLGWLAVGLGLIGIILPVLPTTPFMILAAFLFTKGSPRALGWSNMQDLALNIQNWESRGAISATAKKIAILAMLAVFAVSLTLSLNPWILGIQFVCMVSLSAWVVRHCSS